MKAVLLREAGERTRIAWETRSTNARASGRRYGDDVNYSPLEAWPSGGIQPAHGRASDPKWFRGEQARGITRLLPAAWFWLHCVSHPSLEPSPARDRQLGPDVPFKSGYWIMTAAPSANSPELLMVPFLFLVVGVFMVGTAPMHPGRFRGIRGAMYILIAIGFVTQTWWLLFGALLIVAAFNVYVYA